MGSSDKFLPASFELLMLILDLDNLISLKLMDKHFAALAAVFEFFESRLDIFRKAKAAWSEEAEEEKHAGTDFASRMTTVSWKETDFLYMQHAHVMNDKLKYPTSSRSRKAYSICRYCASRKRGCSGGGYACGSPECFFFFFFANAFPQYILESFIEAFLCAPNF